MAFQSMFIFVQVAAKNVEHFKSPILSVYTSFFTIDLKR